MSLRGSFVEAFLYFDYLWLIDAEGNVSAFDPAGFWGSRDGAEAGAAGRVFGRNDELVQGEGGLAFHDQQDPAVRRFVEAGDVVLEAGEVERHSVQFDARVDAASVLDMRCYYGRAFVATERGISQYRLHGRGDLAHLGAGVTGNGRLGGRVVHDGKCHQLRGKYGVVSAACGGDGGFYADGAASGDPAWRPNFRKFSDRSRATEIVGTTVTNVGRGVNLEFYGTDFLPRDTGGDAGSGERSERGEITGVGGIDDRTTAANASIHEEEARRAVSFKRTFLASRAVFALDGGNGLQRFALLSGKEVVVPKAQPPFSAAPDDVIGMTASATGVIAEMVGSVALLSGGEWHRIKDEPVYSVRGYPASQWYRNLITIVGDGAVDLLFVSV